MRVRVGISNCSVLKLWFWNIWSSRYNSGLTLSSSCSLRIKLAFTLSYRERAQLGKAAFAASLTSAAKAEMSDAILGT